MQELIGSGGTATQSALPEASKLVALCSSDIPAYVGMPVYAPLFSVNQLVVDYIVGYSKRTGSYDKIAVRDAVTGDVQMFCRQNLRDGVLMVWPEEAVTERERLAALRGIDDITAEIRLCKQQTVQSIVRIGQCLIEAKELLPQGQWIAWLENTVEFSQSTARRFVQIAREYSNRAPVRDLNYTALLALLAIPAEEREGFLAETHEVNGQQKTVEEMSKRELQQVIKERNEANKRAAQAEERISSACAAAAQARAEAAQLKQQLEVREAQSTTGAAELTPEQLAAIQADERRKVRASVEAEHREREAELQRAKAQLHHELEQARACTQDNAQPFPKAMLEQAVSAFFSGIDSAVDHFMLMANCMEPRTAAEKTQECLDEFDLVRKRLEGLLRKASEAAFQCDDIDLPELD